MSNVDSLCQSFLLFPGRRSAAFSHFKKHPHSRVSAFPHLQITTIFALRGVPALTGVRTLSCHHSRWTHTWPAGLQGGGARRGGGGGASLRLLFTCHLRPASPTASNGMVRSDTPPRWRRNPAHTFASSPHREAWDNCEGGERRCY